MSNLLRELYYWHCEPDKCASENTDYHAANQEAYEFYSEFKESLSDKQAKQLNQYSDLRLRKEEESNFDYFLKGFKLCARLIVEALE